MIFTCHIKLKLLLNQILSIKPKVYNDFQTKRIGQLKKNLTVKLKNNYDYVQIISLKDIAIFCYNLPYLCFSIYFVWRIKLNCLIYIAYLTQIIYKLSNMLFINYNSVNSIGYTILTLTYF